MWTYLPAPSCLWVGWLDDDGSTVRSTLVAAVRVSVQDPLEVALDPRLERDGPVEYLVVGPGSRWLPASRVLRAGTDVYAVADTTAYDEWFRTRYPPPT